MFVSVERHPMTFSWAIVWRNVNCPCCTTQTTRIQEDLWGQAAQTFWQNRSRDNGSKQKRHNDDISSYDKLDFCEKHTTPENNVLRTTVRHIPIVGATTSWALRPSAGFKPSTKNLRHFGQTETDVGAFFPSSHTLPNLIMNGCPIESVNIIFEGCVNMVNLTVRCDTARNWGWGWAAVKTWWEDRKEKKKKKKKSTASTLVRSKVRVVASVIVTAGKLLK